MEVFSVVFSRTWMCSTWSLSEKGKHFEVELSERFQEEPSYEGGNH